MAYRRLGRSGLNISKVVLGTMNFDNPADKEESMAIVDRAIDCGINLFDCADTHAGGESEDHLTFCDTLVPPGTFVSNHFNTCGWSK